MSKVKLLSNLQTENGVIAEGEVIDLPDAQAEHLISLGAAESSDGTTTAEAPQEVETPADPLVPQTAGPLEVVTPTEQPAAPAAEPSTPEAPASSSTGLHLG